jgi:type IV pilus assembly protein PilA
MLTAINQSVGTLRRRLDKEQSGFTLIELLVVLVIIGVLLAIAVPSYLGFKKRAEKSAAQSNVRAAIPSVEAYYSDNGDYQFTKLPNGTAAGSTLAALKAIDSGIASVVLTPGASTYTVSFTKGACYATITGPGGTISTNC